jgi:hypothetical protein
MVVKDGKVVEISKDSGHYWPKQSLNDQVFEELEAKGMSSSDLDDVIRSCQNDSGGFMAPKKQSCFKQAKNWDGSSEIPDDWDDF